MIRSSEILHDACSLLLFAALYSCSPAVWYNGFQAQQRRACLELPSSEYATCMENANRDYATYRREREERLAKP